MLCPFCREKDTSVVDSRPTEDGAAIRRRRVCGCERKERFTTFEIPHSQSLARTTQGLFVPATPCCQMSKCRTVACQVAHLPSGVGGLDPGSRFPIIASYHDSPSWILDPGSWMLDHGSVM